ncbi:MAG: tRNA dihydrouridine synthase DusB [Treponema sp.]|nr:tRNA dihydrouridine synthase DusB [Candidatus Treponema equifaecale]
MTNLYHPVQIGNLSLAGNVFLAPMADVSDASYRSICADCGADFAYTELISSEALVRDNQKTFDMMVRAPNEKAYAVQIFGSTEETMANAARVVLAKTSCECLDINCGCPVPKVTKTGAGSVLTREPEKLYKITKAVVEAVQGYCDQRPDINGNLVAYSQPIPVTVKIRMGWDSQHITYKDCAQAALEAGAQAIAIHGRTTAQGYEGKASWEVIKELVDFVGGRIPVIGNGDIKVPEDAARMIQETGCDAVMVARGARGNPFIFTKIREHLTTGKITEIPFNTTLEAGFREMALLVEAFGETPACMKMRGRFSNYVKGFDGAKELRLKIVQAKTVADFQEIFKPYL